MLESNAPDATLTDKLASRKFLMAVLFNAVVALLVVLDKIPAKEGLGDIMYVTLGYLGIQGLVDGAGLLASSRAKKLIDVAEDIVLGPDHDKPAAGSDTLKG